MRRGLVWLILLVACRPTDQPIRIGVAGPFGGPVGLPMRRAAELAVSEINTAGGVDGRLLSLVIRDDGGDPDSAVRVATDLAGQGVVAVVGHVYSGTTLAAAPIYGSAPDPIPVLTPSSTAPEVTQAGPHVFRLCPTDLENGAALAGWVRRGLGLERGAVLYLNTPYGRSVRQAFADRFAALGGSLMLVAPYLGDAPDVGPFLERMQQSDPPQFLMIAGNLEDAREVISQVRALGLALPILGGDGLEGIEAAGAVGEGVYLTTAWLPTVARPASRRFVAAYRARFPDAGDPTQPAAATYDALYLLRDLLRDEGVSRSAVREAILRLGNELPAFQGVTGVLASEGTGDLARSPVLIGRVSEGRVVPVERP
jgi:branched-chain amino acid transport system substrate-binding protein